MNAIGVVVSTESVFAVQRVLGIVVHYRRLVVVIAAVVGEIHLYLVKKPSTVYCLGDVLAHRINTLVMRLANYSRFCSRLLKRRK